MKKLLTISVAIALVFSLALTAQAINTVQMTLTSPAITKNGCEKVGSASFGFDAGTQIVAGQDWWYMDLPVGTFICETIDYVLTGNNPVPTGTGAVNIGLDQAQLAIGNFFLNTVGASMVNGIGKRAGGAGNIGPGESFGPFSLTDLGTPGGNLAISPGNFIAFHVYAPKNGRRVWMYAYDDNDTDEGTITVPAGTQFNVKILDGNAYEEYLLLDVANSAGSGAGNHVYGDGNNDYIKTGTNPHKENTLCVNAQDMSGDLMFTSFFSKENKFTFTGDSQIAHVASTNPISMVNCKGATTGNILLGDQNSCAFDYEAGGAASGYCLSTFKNRLFLEGSSTFGEIGDKWDITLTSNTPGVYISAVPKLAGLTPSEVIDCTTPFAGAVSGTFTKFLLSSGEVAAGWPTNGCSVTSTSRVVQVKSENGAITNIHTYDTLWVDMAAFFYDRSVVGNGVEASVTISLSKYPCGVIGSWSKTIGTFVTTCPASTGTTTSLLFPWFPPMDGSLAPWWGGFIIVNAGTGSGTAALTFWEVDGDSGTLTTPSLATGEQYNPGALSNLVGLITQTAGTGAIGDANFAITATCNFAGAGGFAFTGNGIEATGYTAYVGNGGAWQ